MRSPRPLKCSSNFDADRSNCMPLRFAPSYVQLKRWVEKGKEAEVANDPGAAPPPTMQPALNTQSSLPGLSLPPAAAGAPTHRCVCYDRAIVLYMFAWRIPCCHAVRTRALNLPVLHSSPHACRHLSCVVQEGSLLPLRHAVEPVGQQLRRQPRRHPHALLVLGLPAAVTASRGGGRSQVLRATAYHPDILRRGALQYGRRQRRRRRRRSRRCRLQFLRPTSCPLCTAAARRSERRRQPEWGPRTAAGCGIPASTIP